MDYIRKHNNERLKHLIDMYNSIHPDIVNRKLSKRVVHSCLVHLPNRNIEGWSEEIYQLSDKFLTELYQYSLEMGFIDSSVTFEEFLEQ